MKLNILFLILFLILSIKTEIDLDSYSIQIFKDYIKDKGFFEIIESIKMVYGQDIAIISCEELNKNNEGNCKRLVIDYMPESSSSSQSMEIISKGTREYLKCIEKLYYSKILEQSYQNSDIKRELESIFDKDISKSIYVEIKKRVKKLGPCEE